MSRKSGGWAPEGDEGKGYVNSDYIFMKKEVRSTERNEVWVLRRGVQVNGEEDRVLSWDNERLLNSREGRSFR